MTSPRVEKKRQVVCTNTQAVKPKTASSTTAPLLSFKSTQNNTGLSIEHTAKPKQLYVQSYVKVKSKDGKTYNFNATLEKRINNVTAKLQKAEKENGLIGKAWSWTKNTIGFGDSSNKVREIQANERKLLAQFNTNEQARANVFKQLTGCEYNEENLEKFIKGQIKLKSEIAIQKYKEGQEMAVDITSDIVSGVVAYGTAAACIAVGIAAAPFTAGASLGAVAVGVGIAAGAGAATKVAIKGGEALFGGKKYSLKQAGKDATIGAVSGALAPVTIGAGGAVATSVGKVAPKFIATTARLSVEGATFGAADGGVRSALEGDSIGEVALNTAIGASVGIVAGNVLGHGGSVIGKIGKEVSKSMHTKINIQPKVQAIKNFIKGEVDVEHAAALLRNPKDFEEAFKIASKNIKDKNKLLECRTKILEQIDRNIANHGSIVMQSRINPNRVKIHPETGIKYVELTQDDIILAHSVQSNNSVAYIENIINACKKTDNKPYLSLSLNNKNSEFFCFDSKYGIVAKNRSINVTSAGYGQVSCYDKIFDLFVQHYSINYSQNCENNFLHERLINNLKNSGINLTDNEYVQLYKQICTKEYFNEITEDIIINGKQIKASTLRNAIEESHSRLAVQNLSGSNSVNEVTSIIDDVEAIYARVDRVDDVDKEIVQLLKRNPSIKLYLLGEPKNFSLMDIPKYKKEYDLIEQLFKDKKITAIQRWSQLSELKKRFSPQLKEQLRPRIFFEINNN